MNVYAKSLCVSVSLCLLCTRRESLHSSDSLSFILIVKTACSLRQHGSCKKGRTKKLLQTYDTCLISITSHTRNTQETAPVQPKNRENKNRHTNISHCTITFIVQRTKHPTYIKKIRQREEIETISNHQPKPKPAPAPPAAANSTRNQTKQMIRNPPSLHTDAPPHFPKVQEPGKTDLTHLTQTP